MSTSEVDKPPTLVDGRCLKYRCLDNKYVDVPRNMALLSEKTLEKLRATHQIDLIESENWNTGLTKIDIVVKCTQGASHIIAMCVDFCRYHMNCDKMITVEQTKWDRAFEQLDSQDLCQLAASSYFLNIKPLTELSCRAIAKLMADKDVKAIREAFNIVNDTPPTNELVLPEGFKMDSEFGRVRLAKNSHLSAREEILSSHDKLLELKKTVRDERSVDDLLSFIHGGNNKNSVGNTTTTINNNSNQEVSAANKKKKEKKKRQKERKNKEKAAAQRSKSIDASNNNVSIKLPKTSNKDKDVPTTTTTTTTTDGGTSEVDNSENLSMNSTRKDPSKSNSLPTKDNNITTKRRSSSLKNQELIDKALSGEAIDSKLFDDIFADEKYEESYDPEVEAFRERLEQMSLNPRNYQF